MESLVDVGGTEVVISGLRQVKKLIEAKQPKDM